MLSLKFTYLNKTRQKSIDIAISTQIFRIQWESIVDHCNNQPWEKDVEGTFSHFWSFDQDKNLFKYRQEFLHTRQFNFNFFYLLSILILKKGKLVGIIFYKFNKNKADSCNFKYGWVLGLDQKRSLENLWTRIFKIFLKSI